MIRAITKHVLAGVKESIKPYLAWIPYSWRRGPTYRRWRQFLASCQSYSPEQIAAWQLRNLKEIVAYAYNNTGGYRELFRQSAVSPEDIRALRDIRALPFTTKELLRDNIQDFSVSSPLRFYTSTGGSTGIPFGFYELYENKEIEDAFIHHMWTSVGWKSNELNAVLRGSFVGSQDAPWKIDTFRNELQLSSYYLTGGTLDRYIEAIRLYRPRVLQAYPSSLNMLCDLLWEHDRIEEVDFELVILASENVYDWMLEKFERVFPRARFFSFYGHAELTILAPWCESSREYHLCPFYGLTEVIAADGTEVDEGNEGELVGTSFHMRATPFIRYRTMDMAVRGGDRCLSCGRHARMLKRITGRSHEVIVTSTGRHISMTALNMHTDVFDNVRQFQFFQDTPGKVEFRAIRKRAYSDSDTVKIRHELETKLGSDMKLEIRFVDEIPRSPSGKFRFLEQKLPVGYHDR
ncbi:MAG TPA: hypothetical protein VK463_14650 [Desulfomonilaceae bacterium]|nr:hypothetical protein [Desulfomonilaceae bacterium]